MYIDEEVGPILAAAARFPDCGLAFGQRPDSSPLRHLRLESRGISRLRQMGIETRALRLPLVRVLTPTAQGDDGNLMTVLLTNQATTAAHVHVSRRENEKGPVDEALANLRLKREVTTIVGGYAAALALAKGSDLVATVHERHTGILFAGMHSFALPLPIPRFTVSQLWHPRLDGDPAHRWLRGCMRDACAD